jgi:MerR family transcriptional regulator, light-induced transcriptional regulator
MAKTRITPSEPTYPLRSAARLTGLSAEVLRAWERRHQAVEPLRTPGGTRRYRASDLERLRLLKDAVDAGHRIGRLAGLSNSELERLGSAPGATGSSSLGEIFAAIDALDAAELQRLLSIHLSTLGLLRFVREVALPLVREVGERWAAQRLGIASEHLATAALRSMLGSALQPGATALRGSRIVFATLSGERHELGLLMAALTALGAGGNPIYLGAEVPVEELLAAVERSGAAVLALSFVTSPPAEVARSLAALRAGLPADVHLWIGGSSAAQVARPQGVDCMESLDALEQRVGLLAFEKRER